MNPSIKLEDIIAEGYLKYQEIHNDTELNFILANDRWELNSGQMFLKGNQLTVDLIEKTYEVRNIPESQH